jgi:hypothetical protein
MPAPAGRWIDERKGDCVSGWVLSVDDHQMIRADLKDLLAGGCLVQTVESEGTA